MTDPTHTLLVVEDDPRLRYLTELVLKPRYERILVAAGAPEAMELFDREEIDAVFTDIVMPGGIDGVAMAGLMRERRPEIRLLMTSGDPGFIPPDWPHCLFLSKPYGKEPLFAALDELLA